ncbi:MULTISPECIES: pentapeptide repeat-containing protein [unclassified Streptomyces]|uniref:pentapeptide repeat-containing protein n=1 Tax=unclassified Streptomyces TaxID=2593676 RepID=UPI001F5446F4|nr:MULTISPECIES: pentapeptide repeat-containing protein [unclassified Streptomyces]
MSADAPEGWKPTAPPADPAAARRLREWLADPGHNLNGMGQSFRGANLSGGNFSSCWFTDAVLVDVPLVGASFYRADLQSADLTRADLTDADMVKANLDKAILRSAVFDGADLVGASLCGADARGASFRGTQFIGAVLLATDMRGADLSEAVVRDNFFEIKIDDTTVVRGLRGTVFGPITVVEGDSAREVGGAELEAWIAARGGEVQVIPPRRPSR